jgi:hypothetical protein
LLCIVLTLFRRAHAEFRLAVGTHTAAPPSFGTHSHVHPRGWTPQFSCATCSHTCSPGSKVLPFLGRDSWPTHTHRIEPGMPVPLTCLRRSGPFLLCRHARSGTSPLIQMHARASLCRRMVLWPCPSHIGHDPDALVATVLSFPLLSPPWTSGAFHRVVSHPSSSFPSQNYDQSPCLSLP